MSEVNLNYRSGIYGKVYILGNSYFSNRRICSNAILFIHSVIGFYKKKDTKTFEPQKKFAMLVAAHNEEVVIENLVESLKHLDYPKELYDIFVIADNCTDNTAKIARAAGANVFERFNKEKRGKGFALEWMFDKYSKWILITME